MIIAVEPFFFKLIGTEEKQISKLIPIIKAILKNLPTEDLERRVFLRKFTGEGDLKGILDYVPNDTIIIEYNKLDLETEDYNEDFIIGPLNMDELQHFYKRILKNNIAIYPFTHNLINSKFFRNIMFYPHVPEMLYVPEFSLYRIKNFDFNKYFKERNVKRVILKDEFGFHSGQILNYRIVSVDKINEELKVFKEKVRSIEDFGGIIVEEFLAGIESEVFKNHIFGELIPNEVLNYKIRLKGLEGVFKAYTKDEPQLLDEVTTSVGNISKTDIQLLNPFIKQYLPYSFSSIDFIFRDDKPVIIDVNSKAGSLGEVQEKNNSNDHNPFEYFLNKCQTYSKKEYQTQMKYLEKFNSINLKIRTLDGIFTVKDGKIENLIAD
ncbi:MAG: hypothetical protein HWN67_09455 [Candidatus Helarchaeota archaeon]|nr:hypothetical protein [Candidatus Helarchaeota archaeon]